MRSGSDREPLLESVDSISTVVYECSYGDLKQYMPPLDDSYTDEAGYETTRMDDQPFQKYHDGCCRSHTCCPCNSPDNAPADFVLTAPASLTTTGRDKQLKLVRETNSNSQLKNTCSIKLRVTMRDKTQQVFFVHGEDRYSTAITKKVASAYFHSLGFTCEGVPITTQPTPAHGTLTTTAPRPAHGTLTTTARMSDHSFLTKAASGDSSDWGGSGSYSQHEDLQAPLLEAQPEDSWSGKPAGDGNNGASGQSASEKGSLNLRDSDDKTTGQKQHLGDSLNLRGSGSGSGSDSGSDDDDDHDTLVLERHEDEAIMNMYANQAAMTARADAENNMNDATGAEAESQEPRTSRANDATGAAAAAGAGEGEQEAEAESKKPKKLCLQFDL